MEGKEIDAITPNVPEYAAALFLCISQLYCETK